MRCLCIVAEEDEKKAARKDGIMIKPAGSLSATISSVSTIVETKHAKNNSSDVANCRTSKHVKESFTQEKLSSVANRKTTRRRESSSSIEEETPDRKMAPANENRGRKSDAKPNDEREESVSRRRKIQKR